MTNVAVAGARSLAGVATGQAGKAGLAFMDIVQALLAPTDEVSVQAGLAPALLAGRLDLDPQTLLAEAETADAPPLPAEPLAGAQPGADSLLPPLFLPMTPGGARDMIRGGEAADVAVGRQNLPGGIAQRPEASLLAAPTVNGGTPRVEADALVAVDPDVLPETMPIPPADKALEAMTRLSPGNPAAPPAQLVVATPLSGREWSTDFSQRVLWMVGQRLQTAEITVNPPNLGGIEVRLSLHDQGAGAQFFAANPSVRDALDAALPRLRDMLAEAGISLLQAEVRDQAFTQNQSWRGGQGDEQGAGAVGTVHALPLGRASGQGLIDLYA